jgi:hypothetical protein
MKYFDLPATLRLNIETSWLNGTDQLKVTALEIITVPSNWYLNKLIRHIVESQKLRIADVRKTQVSSVMYSGILPKPEGPVKERHFDKKTWKYVWV